MTITTQPRPDRDDDTVDVDGLDGIDTSLEAGVPHPALRAVLASRGLPSLRTIQTAAVQHGLFWRRSMLVSSPSGSGKTLVGELAAVTSVLDGYGRAAYLVPLKALATEKYRHLASWYAPLGVRVELCIGDYDMPPADLRAADIVVMTYEKLDAMLRSASIEGDAGFATIVVDEVHVIGEQGRGPRLESLLVRAVATTPDVQLVALSATIANPGSVRAWLASLGLDVVLLLSNARPVPLSHEVIISRNDVQDVARLIDTAIAENGQCLVFTRSRRKAETTSRQLAGLLGGRVEPRTREARSALAFRARRANPHGSLAPLLQKGVAYHHAGLAPGERDAVEHGFLHGMVDVICCTTTLSAGINLPARHVVIMDYKQVQAHERQVADATRFTSAGCSASMFVPMPRNTFHQIAGRAGRAGFDTEGTATVLVHSSDEAAFVKDRYFTGDAPRYDPLASCLSDREHAREQLLVAVAGQGTLTTGELRSFFAKTFFNHERDPATAGPVDAALNISRVSARSLGATSSPGTGTTTIIEASPSRISGKTGDHECQLSAGGTWTCTCKGAGGAGIDGTCPHVRLLVGAVLRSHPDLEPALDEMLVAAMRDACHLDYLADNGFITVDNDEGRCSVTSMGKLVTQLYITPTAAVAIKAAILTRIEGDGEQPEVAWLLHVARDILAATGQGRPAGLFIAAWHWVHEQPMDVVLSPGMVPATGLDGFPATDEPVYAGDFGSFTQDLARWARACGRVAAHLGLGRLAGACHGVEVRVVHGVKAELLPLVTRVTGVGRVRGRLLFDAGFTTPVEVATADPHAVHEATGLSIGACEKIVAAARKARQDAANGILEEYQ